MNKVKMSVIVILTTILTVCMMIAISDIEELKNEIYSFSDTAIETKNMGETNKATNSSVKDSSIENKDKTKANDKNTNASINTKDTVKVQNSKTNTDTKVIKKPEVNTVVKTSKPDYKAATIQKKLEKGNSNIDTEAGSDAPVAPVFKVSKSQIKLSLSDIVFLKSKLSMSDIVTAKKYVAEEDEVNAVKDILNLMKDRMSDKDYEKAREIASKYVNMEVIEKK